MSFASEPERDDGSLPPVNIVIPDDARELDRDVLAYRREMRALRRRQRRRRLLRPFSGPGRSGPAALVPLIALCLALALVGGALLSVLTISPAEQENALTPSATPRATTSPSPLTPLPPGNVRLDGETEQVRSLVSSAIALVPNDCGCGPALSRLDGQARRRRAPIGVYFVGVGGANAQQLTAETDQFGNGHAVPGDDADRRAGRRLPPGRPHRAAGLQRRHRRGPQEPLRRASSWNSTPGELNSPGAKADGKPSAQAHPTAGTSAG